MLDEEVLHLAVVVLVVAGEGAPERVVMHCFSGDAVFAKAFGGDDALVCFAMKANSNQAVLATLGRLGAGMDIVSGGELARVLAAGGDAAAVGVDCGDARQPHVHPGAREHLAQVAPRQVLSGRPLVRADPFDELGNRVDEGDRDILGMQQAGQPFAREE